MIQLQALFSKLPAPDVSKALAPTTLSVTVTTPGPYSNLQSKVDDSIKPGIDPKQISVNVFHETDYVLKDYDLRTILKDNTFDSVTLLQLNRNMIGT